MLVRCLALKTVSWCCCHGPFGSKIPQSPWKRVWFCSGAGAGDPDAGRKELTVCPGIASRAALQGVLQGRGSLAVPECFCARAEPVLPQTHPTGITCGHSLVAPRKCALAAGPGSLVLGWARRGFAAHPVSLVSFPSLAQLFHCSVKQIIPETMNLAWPTLLWGSTKLPCQTREKNQNESVTRSWGTRGTAGKHSLLPGLPLAKGHQTSGMGSPPPSRRNAAIFPGRAEASTGDTRGDSVPMLAACRSSVFPERGRCWV